MPHPYSSFSVVRNIVKAAPQMTFETVISGGIYYVISFGSITLLLDIPSPGSNESPEKPRPSYPYMDMPHPHTWSSFVNTTV